MYFLCGIFGKNVCHVLILIFKQPCSPPPKKKLHDIHCVRSLCDRLEAWGMSDSVSHADMFPFSCTVNARLRQRSRACEFWWESCHAFCSGSLRLLSAEPCQALHPCYVSRLHNCVRTWVGERWCSGGGVGSGGGGANLIFHMDRWAKSFVDEIKIIIWKRHACQICYIEFIEPFHAPWDDNMIRCPLS